MSSQSPGLAVALAKWTKLETFFSFFSGGPDSHAIDAQKIPEKKHELYQFFGGGEFCFDSPDQNYTSEIIFAGRGRKLESAISEMR